MRCARAAIRRCAPSAIGIDVRAHAMGRLHHRRRLRRAGRRLFAFSKGAISPETLSVPRSVDGLVMVLLGGVQTLTGPVVGRGALHLAAGRGVARRGYWRAAHRRRHPAPRPALPAPASPARRENGARRVSRLSKAYGGVEAVRDVSFGVAAGEMVALIGPNGAGKTTCFNMLNGQLAPDAGDVRLDGRQPARPAAAPRSGGSASAAPSRSPPRSPR